MLLSLPSPNLLCIKDLTTPFPTLCGVASLQNGERRYWRGKYTMEGQNSMIAIFSMKL